MTDKWKVKVWGSRGSFPTPGADFVEYGGNTSCISVDYGDGLVIFDGGSGLLELGRSMKECGRKRVDILVSHLHMDHCLGLLGFPMFLDPHARIHLYGSPHQGMGFRESLETLLGPPYWPLGLKDFPAHVEVHELTPGESFRLDGTGEPLLRDGFRPDGIEEPAPGEDFRLDGTKKPAPASVTVRTLAGNHPNQSLIYRMDSNDKSVIYTLDCELDEQMKRGLATFAQGGSLLIWDASYMEEELPLRRGWGHSSWQEGVAMRRSAGAAKVLMSHFSSGYTDAVLREQERLCTLTDPASLFAREGMEILI